MKGAAKDGMDPTMDMNIKKPSMLKFMGLAGNFGHLNLRDPFDVKKRGSTYVTEIRAGHGGFDGLTIFIKERLNVCMQGSPTSLCFSAWNVLLVDHRHWGTAQPGSCPH